METSIETSVLHSLQTTRVQTALLEHTETRIVETTKRLDHASNLLSETCAEQMQLQDERDLLLQQLRAVQRDIEVMESQTTKLQTEQTQIQTLLDSLHSTHAPLQDQVDALRMQHGLKPRPTLQQVVENQMSSYLDERRGRWIKNGLADPPPSSKRSSLTSAATEAGPSGSLPEAVSGSSLSGRASKKSVLPSSSTKAAGRSTTPKTVTHASPFQQHKVSKQAKKLDMDRSSSNG
ncbi:hypothetical protein BASA61_003585 [Batrachochytrium salamandrivorans]|nr:hypothetical protein BASA61_003585 [Batrachochytrium salamandrivorans]KAH9247770.1 hypothetical protein BASA81_014608 [Batrachochytrium salamandrivorans]KAH9265945.1 hypothetical protein BASA83_010853 [Batrachochytrium salamandrivorans]KAJ1336248.1 hypothetical protein BSLG_007476 [Batrachochytrium salamandrivorans]